MEFFRRYRTAILLAAAVGFAACTLSFAYLTSVVTSRFNGRRWNLPSRIYSDVKAVSEGLSSTPEDLAEKLRRLYYRRTGTTGTAGAVPTRQGSPRRLAAILRGRRSEV